MSNLIKKNGWILAFVVVLLLAVRFFWPEANDKDLPQQVIQAPKQEAKIESPTFVSNVDQTSPPASEVLVPADEKIIQREDVFVEEDEEDEFIKQNNYILCEHILSGITQYEFTGEIRLINKGKEPIYGWSVQWEYEDGSTIIDAQDVALGGNNPYTAEYLASNAEIAPGKTVTFSFTGVKGGENPPTGVEVTGEFCM